ncbi:MAG: DMT family transporter [Pseudomonadota bacterium]
MRFAYVFLVAAPVFWAGNFILGRALSADITPLQLNTMRWALAGLALLPVLVQNAPVALRTLRLYPGQLALLSLLGIVGFNLLLYAALQSADASQVVGIFAFNPVVVLLLATALGRVQLSGMQMVGSALSTLGVFAIVWEAEGTGIAALSSGLGYAIAATICWAAYTCAIGRSKVSAPPAVTLALTVWIGLVVLVPWALISGPPILLSMPSPSLIASALYLGIGASVLAFYAWQRGVAQIGAVRAGVFMNLVPVFTMGLAVALLSETLDGLRLAGLATVIVGVIITQRCPPRETDTRAVGPGRLTRQP